MALAGAWETLASLSQPVNSESRIGPVIVQIDSINCAPGITLHLYLCIRVPESEYQLPACRAFLVIILHALLINARHDTTIKR